MNNIRQNLFMLLFVFTHVVFSFSPFSNYTSANRVNDIVIDNSYVLATTKGGLMRIKPSEDKVWLKSGAENFPDLNLTALCMDDIGNLWVGTEKGYLYKISPKGRHTIYRSYSSYRWGINDIFPYGKYLIIGFSSVSGSPNGCSIFDTDKKVVLQSAVSFGSFKSSIVHCIAVFRDTLYLGCDEGVAKLDVSGEKIKTNNFLDESIWNTEYTDSAIFSSPVYNGSIHFMNRVAAVWNNSLVYSNDSLVYIDNTRICKLPSKVISITGEKDGDCWFGTEKDYLYRWNGEKLKQYKIKGLTFRIINRIYVAENGTIWCTPHVTYWTINKKTIWPWWQGIAAFDGEEWFFYSPYRTSNFGGLGAGSEFYGIAEDSYGNMWFGTNGKCIKKFNTDKNKWDRYYIGVYGGSTFKLVGKNEGMGWGKCDAIAQDSSGYMWFSAWNSDSGCVFCYNPADKDPDKSSYQYFFPKESPHHLNAPFSLNVDVAGSIFIGGNGKDDNGKLVIFNYEGDPLIDSINTPILDTNLTKIWHMASTADTGTWIVTGQGLFYYKFNNSVGPLLIEVEDAPVGINCIEIESSSKYLYHDIYGNPIGDSARIETVLWLGTQLDGLKRVSTFQIVNKSGGIEICKVDSIKIFTENDGLVSNVITYMDMDRKNGYLWIATNDGLSRYNIGHSFEKVKSNTKMSAYPNPFIHSRHKEVVFENLAPGSSVSIYTVDGRLVAYIVDKGSNVRKTMNEWTYIWRPDSDILPGTYFYTANTQQSYERQRQRAAVGKLLILQ